MGHTAVGVSDPTDGTTARVETVAPASDAPGLVVRIAGASSGTTVVYAGSDAIYVGGAALTPKWAFVNIAASQTDSVVVAAVAAKQIRVIALAMVVGATATNITFNSKPGGAGTAVTQLFANAANGGAVLPPNQWGWFQTASGEGLTATTGAGAVTGVIVQYIEVG